jgi:beta-glucosidase
VDTLLGKNNPAGRLPITFYTSLENLPSFEDYSMADRTYRYFKGTPLYGFGYGLSYSHFTYKHLKLSSKHLAAGHPLIVEADVSNTSKIAGDEVAEAYLTYPPSEDAPIHALAGFTRTHVPAGATRHVRFTLQARQISQVLPSGQRIVLPGEYTVFVGGSQPQRSAAGVTGNFIISGQYAIAP